MVRAPFYNVYFKESNYNITELITSIRFEDCVDEDNLLKLNIDKITNEEIDKVNSLKGETIVFNYGMYGQMQSGNRLAEIKEISHQYSSSVSLIITCHDKGFEIKRQKSNKIYEDLTSSEIVELIAKRFNFATEITETNTKLTIPIGNKSYWEFCKMLAKKEGFDFFIQDNILKFKERDLNTDSVKTYTYDSDGNKDVISFNPTYQDEPASEKVSASGIDTETGDIFSLFSTPENDSETSLGKKFVKFDANGELLGEESESGHTQVNPDSSEVAIKKQTTKMNKDSLLKNMTGVLQLELDLSVKVEDIITIVGLAKEHSCNWYVNKKTDIINRSGGKTDLELLSNATNNGESDANNVNNSKGRADATAKVSPELRKFDSNGNRIK